jgi:hypothetical protein
MLRITRNVFLAGCAIFVSSLCPVAGAQGDPDVGDPGACVLKSHVYTCDGAAFQKALAASTAIEVEAHNADGIARSQLKDLVTKHLGKSIAADGVSADLDFLLIPIEPEGVISGATDATLGTLRVYSVEAGGKRGHLLWAEDFSGAQDMPWPAVVHGLILQFQAHFHLK